MTDINALAERGEALVAEVAALLADVQNCIEDINALTEEADDVPARS